MYQVHFAANNFEESVLLPHVPPDFPLHLREQNNETYTGISRDYRRIGSMGLRQFSWSSFFPVQKEKNPIKVRPYSFMPLHSKGDGWEYVRFFWRWRERDVPLRLIVIDCPRFGETYPRLSMPCTVDKFDINVARNGDIHYTITVTEYRFVTSDPEEFSFSFGY